MQTLLYQLHLLCSEGKRKRRRSKSVVVEKLIRVVSGETFRFVVEAEDQAVSLSYLDALNNEEYIGGAALRRDYDSVELDSVNIDEKYRGLGLCTPMITALMRAFDLTVTAREYSTVYVRLLSKNPGAAYQCYTQAMSNASYVLTEQSQYEDYDISLEEWEEKSDKWKADNSMRSWGTVLVFERNYDLPPYNDDDESSLEEWEKPNIPPPFKPLVDDKRQRKMTEFL